VRWNDKWDKRENNQSPPINRKVGFGLLTAAVTMGVVYFAYLFSVSFIADCAEWSCIP